MITTIIKNFGLYIGLFDIASEVNKQERYHSGLKQAETDAKKYDQSWAALLYFNDQFVDRARKGEMLGWTILFNGYFKIHIKLLSSQEELLLTKDQTRNFLGQEAHNLICPTGKIAIESFGKIGSSDLRAVLEIEPGVYRVGLFFDNDEMEKHYFLEDEDEQEYPKNDGPDWFIVMKKVGEIHA